MCGAIRLQIFFLLSITAQHILVTNGLVQGQLVFTNLDASGYWLFHKYLLSAHHMLNTV